MHTCTSLASLDGCTVGESMTRLRHLSSSVRLRCAAFEADVARIFAGAGRVEMRTRTRAAVGDVLESLPLHGAAAATMITVLTLEGWATKLDARIRILETIEGLLPAAHSQRLQAAAALLLASDLVDGGS